MIQELINKAKNKYPASVCYTGQLSKDERRALEKLCDVTNPEIQHANTPQRPIKLIHQKTRIFKGL